jgi:hypothetical protein
LAEEDLEEIWHRDGETRAWINQNKAWTKREVVEAGCFQILTIAPPPLTGGLVFANLDPFYVMFDDIYKFDLIQGVVDMIDHMAL